MKNTIKSVNRNLNFYRLLIILSLMSITSQSFGQSNNEVSFYLQGSFSKLDYEVLQKQSEMENGFGLGARYAYYLSQNWSLSTGAELQYIEGSTYLPFVEDTYSSEDMEGENFEFRYRAEDFSENQYTYFINIPLQIQYESAGNIRFYAAGGVKVGLVLNSEYQIKAASLITSGYYPQYDVELNGPEFAGFGDFGIIENAKSDLDLKTNFVANLESGVKFILENSQSLYMGFFIDYGLNDIKPDASGERLINYNDQNPAAFDFGSLLSSQREMNSAPYIDKVRTLAFGLKIQYAFQF